ncbi:glycosyltransferase [Ureibacillus acetophenoni]|uniref:Glycosyltransferase involved in cell wall bisynthesis n=1 Tax=Ureibacillus acetophenoni TaxID=614649 RepID=A0A285U964_9BACL|nr:glycosyltransferase [Ureibacillus acetophenoni]SOC38450.1 glycosyltransferase involved in cell wall bisynthesis [Ureibacillus acetophenoni]
MKVVYLTARPPYPPHKGDQLIAWEQLKQLKKSDISIYLISIISSTEEEELIREKLAPYCKQIYLFKLGKVTKLLNLTKSVINLKPLQVNLFTNRKLKRNVSEILEDIQPDLIHTQTVRVAEYALEKDIPKTLDMIDALSLNMRRRAKKEKFYKKIILSFENILLKRYESKVLNVFEQTFIVSENDKKYLDNNTIVVNPNGTYMTPQYLSNYPTLKREKIILFHGNMQYYPNVEAAYTFATQIWPIFHKVYREYQFYIVGKDPVKKIKQLHGMNNVFVTGFVEDICELLCRAEIAVYPLKSGTGLQNKVVEALSCGLPVIASPLALQGIANISNQEVVTYTTVTELISSLHNLINNQELRNRLSINGKIFANNNFSWEVNCSRLVSAWKRIVKV